jgi:tRNA threonylcarbamoyladenosine biosynthesis protein TsaE
MKQILHTNSNLQLFLPDEASTEAFAARVAGVIERATVIYLEGDLGAGKTTFSRGFIQSLGHIGKVKSPTYTLVEPYEIDPWRIFHFDLYRLSDPEELEYMGIRDYFDDDCLCLIEWPDKGIGLLASADLHISIEFSQAGRALKLEALSAYGIKLLTKLQ